jgi:hypothetical protein
MKSLTIFSFLTFFFSTITYSQNDCSVLKTELNKKNEIINTQNEQITNLEGDIKFYKESLDLVNSKISVKQDDFVFKINSAIGIRDNGIVIIEGLVENIGTLRALRSVAYNTYIYDTKGNNYKASEIKFGNLIHLQEFQKDLPVKFKITFKNIGEEMPIIKNLTAVFCNRLGKKYNNFIFKNLDVNWE